MVIRKASVPYPTSPPPPPPPPQLFGQHSHHQIDSADLPPVPVTAVRSGASPGFEDIGNPWSDDYSRADKSHNLPDLLKPGQPTTPSQNLPDILRPGWSGEVTPRSSLDSDPSPDKDWWDDDDVALEEEARHQEHTPLHVVNATTSPPPSASTIKRKPLPQSHSFNNPPPPQPPNVELASNNPFRRPSETYLEVPTDLPDWGAESRQSRDQHPNPLRSHPSIDRLGNLTLSDPASDKIALIPEPSLAPPPPPLHSPPPIPQLQAPLVPVAATLPPQADLNHSPWATQNGTPPAPSPIPFAPSSQHHTISTDNLLERGRRNGSISLADELRVLPNAGPIPGTSALPEVSLLLDVPSPGPSSSSVRPTVRESDEMYAPPPGPPPQYLSQYPPTKPPRPAVVTSEHDLAVIRDQRNETYQIKHFNWNDPRSSRMRRSSMLIQNKNGPCPLLALVNALILGATEEMQAALDDALRLREQVTLGLIIETLMDELLTKAAMTEGLVLPDVDELNRFLMRLRTGMNANPRFVVHPTAAPNLMDSDSPITSTPSKQNRFAAGTFEATPDIMLYGSFNVKLVHGWLSRPEDRATKAFARSAPTYEDAQAVQFGEEELMYKISHGGLAQSEQQVWDDITSIKEFFQTYPTQLTPYGLEAVQATLKAGEFAILFRNDHFSTIYKHPRNQRLFTLVTDAGYAERDEIVWESLEDITGAKSELFSGEFRSLSHGDSRHPIPHSQTAAANPQRSRQPSSPAPTARALTPQQQQQEQHDADFAMALQMQEEEEQRMRQARARREREQRENSTSDRGGQRNQGPRRSGQGIPIPLRGNTQSAPEVRPSIPPRNTQGRNIAVNRPSDANAVDAPPAYEEAARTPLYVPPVGSPLHPSSSHDLSGRASTSTSNIHAQGQTTGVTGRGQSYRGQPSGHSNQEHDSRPGAQRRRTSAYADNNDVRGQQSPDYSAGAFGSSLASLSHAGADSRRRDPTRRNDEGPCTVM